MIDTNATYTYLLICEQLNDLPTNTHFFVKFRKLKMYNTLDITMIFLKLWIFTNLNMVFPVVKLVFDFDEFSEGVLRGYYHNYFCCADATRGLEWRKFVWSLEEVVVN
jgi:hypothetical protein